MIPLPIAGATRVLAKDQEAYRRLHIRDENHDGVNVMVSAWEPSPEQLKILNAGGKVVLMVIGTVHPPVALDAIPRL